MATTLRFAAAASASHTAESRVVQSIQVTLRYLYGVVPIVAGADKFTNLLTDWSAYVSPFVAEHLPVSAARLLHLAGVIEILAGVLVLLRPRIGGYVVMAWLLAIAAQLLVWGQFLDVAVRDIVLALGGALTLARLSAAQVASTRAAELPSPARGV